MPNTVIEPYEIKRVCKPSVDIEQLTLKPVDNTESVFTRTLVQLIDAGLPGLPSGTAGVDVDVDVIHWDLFLILKYRQDWKPSGYGLGNLVYTTSLLPNEETTLELKTWETEKRLEEVTAGVDTKNTTDIKSVSSESSDVTNKVETKEHEYVDAKAGYSGFGFSASVSAGWSQDVGTMNQDVAKQAQERTEAASNEQKSSRTVKMALSRESGSESKTTRKFKNINQAHTLNVNFYGVLKEYEVSFALYDVCLVLLGAKVFIRNPAYFQSAKCTFPALDDKSKTISYGELIHAIRDAEWVELFTETYGISPIQILREAWSLPLKKGAMGVREWWKTDPITDQERAHFQNTMLRYVRPTSAWVEPDGTGQLRWAYEIIPGREVEALKYLYQFVPYSPAQIVGILTSKGLETEHALKAVLGIKAGGSISVNVPRSTVVRAVGPFNGIAVDTFSRETLPAWVKHITDELDEAKKTIGRVKVNGKDHRKVTLPTQGVYADLTLGVCSGAEDYYEIQRQFDLESKKLEIEKLKLEVQKLTLANQRFEQGKPCSDIVIENAPDSSSLQVNVGLTPSGDTSLKFGKDST